MNLMRAIRTLILVLALGVSAFAQKPIQDFDNFGDLNCEDEWALLDHYAARLNQEPHAIGYIVFYGGFTFRGRLPRRGEAEARAARLKPYLVNQRRIPSGRVVVINGGYQSDFTFELWVVGPGQTPPEPTPIVAPEKVKFRKGKVSAREFRCPAFMK